MHSDTLNIQLVIHFRCFQPTKQEVPYLCCLLVVVIRRVAMMLSLKMQQLTFQLPVLKNQP